MYLSIVIPVYKGEETITTLYQSIEQFCDKQGYSYEVIFVWDYGPDRSWEVITKLKNEHPERIIAVRLSRNFGQHNAIICGFSIATGEFIITMDEDLQHNPVDIEELIIKQKESDFDVVYGNYSVKMHSGFRNKTSLILKMLIKVGIPDLYQNYSAFRLIKNKIAKETIEMHNSYTFLDGYISWITTNISSCQITHNKRQSGDSSYTLRKLISHSVNIFATFSDLPMKIVTWLSFMFFFVTFSYASWILIDKLFFSKLVPGFASIIVLLGFGIGSVLFALGILGQYIHRINLKTTKRPNYIINKIL
jgi:polyisoprenyl-phosphate glycosyltransferase